MASGTPQSAEIVQRETFCRCQRLQAELNERLALLDQIERLRTSPGMDTSGIAE